MKLGQIDQSIEYFKKSIEISQIYKGTWILSRGIEGLAISFWAKKAYSKAAILLSAAEKCRESFGVTVVPNFPVEHSVVLLDLQHILKEQGMRDIWNKGKSLTHLFKLLFLFSSSSRTESQFDLDDKKNIIVETSFVVSSSAREEKSLTSKF
ncbi:hypothetical protein [Paenibacillus peoriae]|uniref:hypothetical protein n=1 Tax=Paenibacillus peoriae TaxID=59893 RepID=UPI00215AB944|nr:hypothetical protein [Paenibacillus peoriae]